MHSAISPNVRESHAKTLRVLVVYDGPFVRKRVEKMLARIEGRFPWGLRFDSTFRRTDEVPDPLVRFEETDAIGVELLLLATECSAVLSPELLSWLKGVLPTLRVNDGAFAVLTGANVPRQMDTLLLEWFLSIHAERLRVPFIHGHLTGLGCPGSKVTPAKPARGRSARPSCQPHGNKAPASSIQIKKRVEGRTNSRAGAGFLRKMVALYRAQPPYELPEEFRAWLHQSLAQRWMEKQGS